MQVRVKTKQTMENFDKYVAAARWFKTLKSSKLNCVDATPRPFPAVELTRNNILFVAQR